MRFRIGIIPGDGIGREVVPAAVTVLEEVGRRYGHQFELKHGLLAGAAMDRGLDPMPQETLEMCLDCDAVLFGAAGDPKYDVPGKALPNEGPRRLREKLATYINLRPIKCFSPLANRTPFKPDILRDVDLVILRDSSGRFRGGKKESWREGGQRYASDIIAYSEREVAPALRFAFPFARSRKGKLAVVSQAGIYATSRIWKDVALEMAADYPDVNLDTMAADNCAMQLVRNPASFDVIVVDNWSMAGMLNNQAAMLMGSIGMGPSATLRHEPVQGTSKQGSLLWGFGWYEPIHGSAPIHAGKNEVNPMGAILSLALLLRYSLGLDQESAAVERSVAKALEKYRTYDLMEMNKTRVGTREMGEMIAAGL